MYNSVARPARASGKTGHAVIPDWWLTRKEGDEMRVKPRTLRTKRAGRVVRRESAATFCLSNREFPSRNDYTFY